MKPNLPTPPEALIGYEAVHKLYLDGWDVIRMSRRAELEQAERDLRAGSPLEGQRVSDDWAIEALADTLAVRVFDTPNLTEWHINRVRRSLREALASAGYRITDKAERQEILHVLEELATHDQCAGWPDKGGCHVAMQGMAARLLKRLSGASSPASVDPGGEV